VFTGVGQGNDGKRWNNIALEVRELVVTRKGDSAINRVDFVALLMPFRSSSFLETTGWDDGPLRVKPIFPEWSGSQAPRSGIEGAVLW